MSDLYGIAKSGLKAYQESLATTGQNIANVGNENYARREVGLSEMRRGMLMFSSFPIILVLVLK